METGVMLSGLRAVGRQLLRLPRALGPLLFVAWSGLIWSLSSMHGKDLPQNFWKAWLVNFGHAPLFGFLAFLALIAFPRRDRWPLVSRKAVAWTLLAVLFYALTDEWHQARVPGRDSSGADILTDLVGASVTLWIAAYLGRAQATGRGLLARIGIGLFLCLLAGLGATCA